LSCPHPISIEPPQLRAEFRETGHGKQPSRRKSPVKEYARAEILCCRDQWISVAMAFQGSPSTREPKGLANVLVFKLDVNETVLSSQPPTEMSLADCRYAGEKDEPMVGDHVNGA
jgi:hypothetical protein